MAMVASGNRLLMTTPLIKKNPQETYSRSSRDDDDSSADEPAFASIGERTSAVSGFAKVKSNSLTHYLYPLMLASVGFIDVCTVGKNNIRQMMIKNIGKKYSAGMEMRLNV